ncbi:isoprenylcysteine carboxylmethyltransferase family protein [Pseudoxanthomonas sp.]|uniref:methyltransferase family protein n=1 Tax=Pseudoxanthomonas sp. TaxID=1871049 RepID=UPI00258B6252|nr:isoprenylcysteine carboxylmethyltransferase family protein [Pseudoxanthomonas sp.]MCR6686759.1 isoprenylcysteine carboxylmethyltransferase family protein [Pseudoxanthomonas sp.]
MRRLLPPLLLILAIALMLLLHRFAPGLHWPPVPWRSWGGMATVVLGLGIAQWHARLFRRRGTNLHTFREPQQLVTEGLFRHSRNPMYLGFALAAAGLALALGAATPVLVLAAFVLMLDRWYIRFEEQAMLRSFGQAYRDYCRHTRRWF